MQWEIASDEKFSRVVQRGTAVARPGAGHSVHVNVQGLSPDAVYFYRFRHGMFVSETGRTRTTPAPGTTGGSFRFAHTSCANWQSGYYQLYADIAAQEVDYWLALGDYIYEYGNDGYLRSDSAGDPLPATRPIPWKGETFTLPEYRRQYSLYKSSTDLQVLHASAPYSMIWDDHEVDNNFAKYKNGGDGEKARIKFRKRRAAGFRAFWENHPIRTAAPSRDNRHYRIYRRVDWGSLATFYLLDGRQYRSDQPGDDTPQDFGGWVEGMFAESQTMLGAKQEAWLGEELKSSGRWTFISQQTVLSDVNGGVSFPTFPTLAKGLYNYDAWDGYWAARRRLFQSIKKADVRNPVVLTGDFHTNLAFDLLSSYPDPRDYANMVDQTAATEAWDKPVIGAELCAGAVSSPTFFGSGIVALAGPGTLAKTPWARYGELQNNGVIINEVSKGSVESTYRVAKTYYPATDVANGGKPRTDVVVTIEDGTKGISEVSPLVG